MATNFRNRSQIYRSRRAVPSRKGRSYNTMFSNCGRNAIFPLALISITLYFFAVTIFFSSNEKYSHQSEHYHPLSIRQEINHHWVQRTSQTLRKVEDPDSNSKPDSNFGHVSETLKNANDHNNGGEFIVESQTIKVSD